MAATKVKELVHNMKGLMDFIDYTSYSDNKEFLRGDLWEFQMIEAPSIVYYPGDNVINTRLNSVSVSGADGDINGFAKNMRGGFVIQQQTGQRTNGTLTLSFTDREDQAISYFVDDWKQKIADRDTKYSFRKEDLVCTCKMIYTNSARLSARELTFYNCIIQSAPLDENGVAEDGSDRADVQLSLLFEHYTREFKNI